MTPPAPITGSAKNAATVSGPSSQDQLFEVGGEPRRERLLALARLRAAIIVRAIGVQDALDRKIEIVVREGKPGQTGGGNRHAVVGALSRNDLLLLRPAECVIDVPRQLDRRVVCLRAGVREQHLAHLRRGHADQPLGELGADRRDFPRKAVVERQFAHLPVGCVGEPPFGKAQRCAPQPGHALEITPALVIVDIDAFATRNDERTLLLHRAQVRRRVQVEGLIAARGRRG